MQRNCILRTASFTLVAVLVLALSAGVCDAAKKKKRKGGGKGNNKQQIKRAIESYKQDAARAKVIGASAAHAARAAAYKAQAEQQQIETAKAHMANLAAYAQQQAARLQQIERSIFDAQPEGSRLRKAVADVASAKEEYERVRAKIFNSTAYKAAYQRALASSNKAVELPKVRHVFIEESADLQLAESAMDVARKRLEQARTEVLSTNPDWSDAVTEVRTSKAALAEAKIAFRNGLLGKTAAASIYRDAASTALRASQAVKQSEARAKQLQSMQKRQNSRSNKRKR